MFSVNILDMDPDPDVDIFLDPDTSNGCGSTTPRV